jgi:methylamine--corrinoid protein Co-methyltransferase
MATQRALTICDVYDLFVKGAKITEDEWDYNVIPTQATKLKEKYKLNFGKNMIPEDKGTINDLYNAGLEMLVSTGFFNPDLKRVAKVTESQVIEGIKKTPTKLLLGEGRDAAYFYPRKGNSAVKPIIQGGPTGAPVSEDIFIQVMQSYAQEAVVDTLVNGVMATIEGNPATTNTPYEIRAMMAEVRAVNEAKTRAGRPNMAI